MYFQAITTPATGPAGGGAAGVSVWSEPVQPDVWQDFVIHVKPSQGSTGLLEVWKNGAPIYQQTGPNVDPYDESGRTSYPAHYLKVGVYNWPWMSAQSNVTTREILYDEVRIGRVGAGYTGGYAGVAPNGGAITFTKAPDVSEAFPTGIIQGGACSRSYGTASSRIKLRAQSTEADRAAINANAYSSTRYSGAFNFIPGGRTITFNNVTMAIQSSGTVCLHRTHRARARGPATAPELVGRMTEKLVFNRLPYATQREICEHMIVSEQGRLRSLGHEVNVCPADFERLLREGHHKTLGARPMRAAVERHLQHAIARQMLDQYTDAIGVLRLSETDESSARRVPEP